MKRLNDLSQVLALGLGLVAALTVGVSPAKAEQVTQLDVDLYRYHLEEFDTAQNNDVVKALQLSNNTVVVYMDDKYANVSQEEKRQWLVGFAEQWNYKNNFGLPTHIVARTVNGNYLGAIQTDNYYYIQIKPAK